MTRKGGSFLVVLFLCIAIARAETPEWFRSARVYGHWIWAAEYEDKLYSDAELKKEVADAAKAGYNVGRLKAYRDSLQELPGNKLACDTHVMLHQILLLTDPSDIDHIIEAVRKIQTHSSALLRV